MKKLALFAILGFFFAVFAFAQTEQPTQAQQPGYTPEQPKEMSPAGKVSGTIDKVDLTAKSFTVKIDKTGETRTFTFDDKTKFDAKDKMFKAENLKAGDHVIVEANDTNLASKIKVHEVGSKTTPEPEKKPENN